MLTQLSATPCPVAAINQRVNKHSYNANDDDNTTAHLDFTTEFKASLRSTGPRRHQTQIKSRTVGGTDFTIYEDRELQVQRSRNSVSKVVSSAQPMSCNTLAQPPQRIWTNTASAPRRTSMHTSASILKPTSSLAQAPRRPKSIRNENENLGVTHRNDTLSHIPSPKSSKPARRGTIFIPTEDTTMPSVYMGIFSPINPVDQVVKSPRSASLEEETGLAAQMARKRIARRSVLVASPKRNPLQPSVRVLQDTCTAEDKAGQPSGKENVPPGHHLKTANASKTSTVSRLKQFSQAAISTETLLSSYSFPQPMACSRASILVNSRSSDNYRKKQIMINETRKPSHKSSMSVEETLMVPQQNTDALEATRPPKTPHRIVAPVVRPISIETSFPLLPDDLSNVSMYEDNWLVYQEIAMTQLINDLFETSKGSGNTIDHYELRRLLLQHYGSSEMMLLHKRLQGSLLYGALSVPQDCSVSTDRLWQDLGRRKAFTDLWLESYDSTLLEIALEVVIGRTSQWPPSADGTPDDRTLRKFIETFLLRNEDLGVQTETTNAVPNSYQKTILRSLMLVKVLDMAKTKAVFPYTSSLFQPESKHKSSASVVRFLMQMLNPSVGDPMRTLNLLGYSVSHLQYPLEEYQYSIKNLAVDLRDGVRLTRLVELLLYRSASPNLDRVSELDSTTTMIMPTGETVSLSVGQQQWPLSQHLKFPCTSRAAKLYNLHIALTALKGVHGMELVTQDIAASDIVDGFREKTIKLLWGLTSKWGSSRLVDWDDVKRETRRLMRVEGFVGVTGASFDNNDEEDEIMNNNRLIEDWARAVVGSQGMVIHNFSTSFTDGKAFHAIIREYEPYLLQQTQKPLAPTCNRLSDRLRRLGCSDQFSQLFAPNGGAGIRPIFDRDFVKISLTFLCSRLLGPTRKTRAATVIQRAWRAHWSKLMVARTAKLKNIAEACSKVAQLREQGAQISVDHCVDSMIDGLAVEEVDIWLAL